MASDSRASELEAVKDDITALRKDIQSLTDLYKDKARSEAEDLASRVKSSAKNATEHVNERVREGVAAASEQIEARPLTSMLVAFGIGLTLGKLLDRR